ncbi:MAG: DUF2147 domain-containing protein [Chitinophagales bacterium]|jgi:uncharacterized protein (DUF2147 family)|nr:DUF2147 domain-containing protein [Chitinophagales bacterium]
MKKLLIFSLLILLASELMAQSPVGKWQTVDDESGQVKSIVEIFQSNGKLYGKIDKLLIKPESVICTKCSGDMKDKPIEGLQILRNMSASGTEWSGGTITDPKSGKTYSCKMSLDGADKLKVRGFLGLSIIGRTQVWNRVK